MKFGALLRTSAGEVPELQELFAAYKQLKKHLKRLPEKEALKGGSATMSPAAAQALGATEADFVAALSRDVSRFNDMFLEREEDAVIRLRSLEDRASPPQSGNDLKDLYRKFVDFHGEMLLLVHWSILAYTGMVKILKKHHKRTGLLVKAPHLDNLAGQPFCSTELMSDLVRKAEADIDALRSRLSVDASPGQAAAQPLEPSHSGALLQAARHRSEGVSPQTLPPTDPTAATAQQLMTVGSDSGSAPSAASDGASDGASDSEVRPLHESHYSPRTAATHGADVCNEGATSSVRAGIKRSYPEAASLSEGAVNSPRRRVHVDTVAEPLLHPGVPPQQQQQPHTQPLAPEGRDGPPADEEAAAAAPVGGHGAAPGSAAAAAAVATGGGNGGGNSGAGIIPQGRCLLEMHLELQRQQVEREGAQEQAGSVAGGSHSSRQGGSPGSAPTANGPPNMLRPTSRPLAAVRQISDASSGRGDPINGSSPPIREGSVLSGSISPQRHRVARGQHGSAVPSGSGPRILAQTQAALGLWKELTETASTPSTVLPLSHRHLAGGPHQHPASSITTDQSAA